MVTTTRIDLAYITLLLSTYKTLTTNQLGAYIMKEEVNLCLKLDFHWLFSILDLQLPTEYLYIGVSWKSRDLTVIIGGRGPGQNTKNLSETFPHTPLIPPKCFHFCMFVFDNSPGSHDIFCRPPIDPTLLPQEMKICLTPSTFDQPTPLG